MENIFLSKWDAGQVKEGRPYDYTPELKQNGEKNEQQQGLPQKQKPSNQKKFIHNAPSLPTSPTHLNAWPGLGSHVPRQTSQGTNILCDGRSCQD